MWTKIKPYVIWIALALGVGILAALMTRGSMDIYQTIVTPPLSPPSILFPIVWTILYVLMGVSAAMIYKKRELQEDAVKKSLTTYLLSLIANFVWSLIFFNVRAYLVAFIWLLLLLYLIIDTIVQYKKIDPLAAYLQIPYALWVAFAGYLNVAIWLLNK